MWRWTCGACNVSILRSPHHVGRSTRLPRTPRQYNHCLLSIFQLEFLLCRLENSPVFSSSSPSKLTFEMKRNPNIKLSIIFTSMRALIICCRLTLLFHGWAQHWLRTAQHWRPKMKVSLAGKSCHMLPDCKIELLHWNNPQASLRRFFDWNILIPHSPALLPRYIADVWLLSLLSGATGVILTEIFSPIYCWDQTSLSPSYNNNNHQF